MKALVTGAAGFAGKHLEQLLEDVNVEVLRFDYRWGRDVRDYETVHAALEEEPDLIFHLAGVTQPGEALNDPRRTVEVNTGGAMNILEAVRNTRSTARILLVGSSEEYGYEHRAADEILSEETVCRPSSAYGVSKLSATTLGMAYHHRYGLPVVAVRPFNYTGWGRQLLNAESAFAHRIVKCERGEAEVVEHGDLSSSRNFTDVRDMVAGFWEAIRCEPGIYNICSPWTLTMQQVMDILVSKSIAKISLKPNTGLGHKVSGPFPVADCSKFRAATGWEPVFAPEETFGQVLDYWRSKLCPTSGRGSPCLTTRWVRPVPPA